MTLQFGWYCTNCHIVAWNGGILPYQIMILVNCFDKSNWCMYCGDPHSILLLPRPMASSFSFCPDSLSNLYLLICKVEYCLKFSPSVFIYKFLHFSLNNIYPTFTVHLLFIGMLVGEAPPSPVLSPSAIFRLFFLPQSD